MLSIFIIVYSFNLTKYPKLWMDEAWFINPAFNLAFHGFFGTTMMPTFHNIGHFTYWQMPCYMILLAISFKLIGFGIFQARIVSVLLGFFTVLFTYMLAHELFSKKVGLLAALLLIFNPLFFTVARQVRMDIAVACFTVIGLYFLIKALKTNKYSYYFLTGIFAILSFLSHPDGIFSIISIVLIYGICKVDLKNHKIEFKLKEILYLILGPILLIMPYLYYISWDFQAFLGQYKANITSSATTPLNNIISEVNRYGILIGFIKVTTSWFALLLIIAALYLTLLASIHLVKNREKFNYKFLIIVLAVHVILLAVLVSQKYAIWYFGIILPYWFIFISLIFKVRFNYNKSLRTIITVFLVTILLINTFGVFNIIYSTKNYDYQTVQPEIQGYIPNGSIVIGDPEYWVTLHNNYTYYDYHYMNNSDLSKLKGSYILYDRFWNYSVHDKYYLSFGQIFAETPIFLEDNCTLIGEIPVNPSIKLSPVYIYKVN